MQETILIKIDVKKIDRNKLFEGKKGTYLDVILIPTPENQFGNDYMAVQGVSKEDREAGLRGEILGNAKINQNKQLQAPAVQETANLTF